MAWTAEELDDAIEAALHEARPLVAAARELDAAVFAGLTEADVVASSVRLVSASRIEEVNVPLRRPPITNDAYWISRMYRRVGE